MDGSHPDDKDHGSTFDGKGHCVPMSEVPDCFFEDEDASCMMALRGGSDDGCIRVVHHAWEFCERNVAMTPRELEYWTICALL